MKLLTTSPFDQVPKESSWLLWLSQTGQLADDLTARDSLLPSEEKTLALYMTKSQKLTVTPKHMAIEVAEGQLLEC